jgi:type II secretory pathway component PulK
MLRLSTSDGYVTFAVLLTVALLAAIVSSLVSVSRPALGLVRIGADEVAAEGLLQGGVDTAAYLLFDAQQPMSTVDGMSLRRDTGSIRINVSDEAGRIDINAAKTELLAGLFAAVGGKSMSPEAFASRVDDWRDQDDEVSPDGAEADEYDSARLSYGPPNGPFRSTDELRFILGLSRADYAALKPFVTTYSGEGTVDPLSASETALQAIPGFDSDSVKLILTSRRQGLDRDAIKALLQQGAEFLSTGDSSVYRVGVQVQLTDGFTDAAESVIIAPQRGGSAGYNVVAWSRLR